VEINSTDKITGFTRTTDIVKNNGSLGSRVRELVLFAKYNSNEGVKKNEIGKV
jgi:hypothetical protein